MEPEDDGFFEDDIPDFNGVIFFCEPAVHVPGSIRIYCFSSNKVRVQPGWHHFQKLILIHDS